MIIRNLDPDVEFQEPLLSLHLSPSPKWPEKVEVREEQPEPPEVRPEEPRRRTGSIACNIEASFGGWCISNITVHPIGREKKSNILVHRAGQSGISVRLPGSRSPQSPVQRQVASGGMGGGVIRSEIVL